MGRVGEGEHEGFVMRLEGGKWGGVLGFVGLGGGDSGVLVCGEIWRNGAEILWG